MVIQPRNHFLLNLQVRRKSRVKNLVAILSGCGFYRETRVFTNRKNSPNHLSLSVALQSDFIKMVQMIEGRVTGRLPTNCANWEKLIAIFFSFLTMTAFVRFL
ncbi:hypothetical protein NPIL_555291 [Nephila pilipes]|uniref:Uncharacterized protein n=1 Tax=Nephila pilipes TaxID=299642 RepID=A0A8X6PA91_NEPPI|nr:hypothetical protein NPIL_555291 [Nephila pilipes]